MKSLLILMLSSILIFNSCFERNSQSKNDVEEILGVPEEEQQSKSNRILDYDFKRGSTDIVEKLYIESIKNDESLNNLNKELELIEKAIIDSTSASMRFININNNYFSTLKTNYINSLNDPILQNKVLEIIVDIEKNYNHKLKIHNNKLNQIKLNKHLLQEKHTLMKIFISLKQIKKYQNSKLPNTKSLDSIDKKIKQLIDKTKVYTK